MRQLPYLGCTCLLLSTQWLGGAEVRTLAGPGHKDAEIVSVSDQEIKLKAGGKETTVPAADALEVTLDGKPAPIPAGVPHLIVRLTDGTTLKCQAFALKSKTAEVRLFSGLAARIPVDAIFYVLCEAHDTKNRLDFDKGLAEFRTANPPQDVLRLLNKEGTAIITFKGIIGDADAEGKTLKFKLEDTEADPEMSRVRSLIYVRKPVENAPKPVARVFDNFENVLFAARIAPAGDGFRLTTPAGLEVEMSKPLVARFDFSLGKIAYLSDVEPMRVVETPFLIDVWHYRRDKNLEGGPLRLGGKVYAKGLAVHSKTVLEYDVKGYNIFYCQLGIDDLVTSFGHAAVTIEADDKLLFSDAVKSKEKPRELNLNIAGAARLKITVDYGDDLDLGDHVTFGEAKVTK